MKISATLYIYIAAVIDLLPVTEPLETPDLSDTNDLLCAKNICIVVETGV